MPLWVKVIVLGLTMGEVAELVRKDLRLANLHIDIAMRVTIDPIINSRIGNIISQLNRKGTIDSTAFELRRGA